jgi:uncharacterized protein YjdB
MKKKFGLSALVSPRVLLGVGLVGVTTLFGGTGCGLSYSLTGLYVEPATGLTCIPNGVQAQFHAYGTYSEGNHAIKTEDLSDQVSWSLGIPAMATISASGLLTAGYSLIGTSPVIATTPGEFGNLTADSSIQVSSSCVTGSVVKSFGLNIVPRNQNLIVGQTFEPLAIATFGNNGTTSDLTRQVAWQSSNPDVATVNAKGVITAVGAGDAVITAQGRTSSGEALSATQTIHISAQGQ